LESNRVYPVIPLRFAVEKQQRPTRPQDPIVLVLSPPWRTVLVLVIERFAVHGINATCVTAYKPTFPNSWIMLLISVSLSITKFLPEQRVDWYGMIELDARSIEYEYEHEHDHEKQP
jgi:hypothetical protein